MTKIKKALISVIIPVYNVEKYLKRCLDSVVNQTLKEIEIICVNDGSTDSSSKILEEYAQKDERIKIVNKQNGGLPSAWNAGLEAAEADFITFVDSDDWIEKETFELAYKAISQNDVDYVYWGANIVMDYDNEEVKWNMENYFAINYSGIVKIEKDIINNTPVTVWSKLYKKEIIKDKNIKFYTTSGHADSLLWAMYSPWCKNGYYLEPKLYNYVQRPNSITGKRNLGTTDKIFARIVLIPALIEYYNTHNLTQKHYDLLLRNIKRWFYNDYCYNDNQYSVQVLDKISDDLKNIDLGILKNDEFIIDILNKKIKGNKQHYTFAQRLFSLKNEDTHKIISLLGLQIKQKRIKKSFTNKKLAVILHIYYHEQTDFIIEKLKNINGIQWDLFVTYSTENQQTFDKIKKLKPDTKFLKVKNLGYDIWPFVFVINSINLDDYDYVLKLHTKGYRREKLWDGTGYYWRDTLFNAILGSKKIFRYCLTILSTMPDVGMVGAKRMICKMTSNYPEETYLYKEICKKLGIKGIKGEFISGTIFLCKKEIIQEFKKFNLQENDFPQYSQTDSTGTISHVLERLFGTMTELKEYRIYGVKPYKSFMQKIKSLIQNVFSIKNSTDNNHKVITFLWIKIKINRYITCPKFMKKRWQEYCDEFINNNKKTIVIIDDRIPEFDKSAGARSTLHIIQTYKELGLNICFLPDNFNPIEPYSQHLRDIGVKLLTDINIDSEKIFKLWLKNYAKKIDYIFLSRPLVCQKYLKEIKKYKNIKILYYGQDLHFLREQRTYEITKDLKYLEKSKSSKKIEYEIIKNADVSYFPSVVEKDLLKKDFPAKDIEVIPVYAYATDNLPAPQKFEDRKDILFVGGFWHAPNADGLKWFVNEIFPQIVKVIPDIKLNVAGSNVTDEIRQLQSTNINILGFVSDEELQNLYKTTRVVIAPLRYGAGMKGKVVEALYNQAPIITTNIGAEGIENRNNVITIANESDDFANKLIELYTNKDKNEYAANNSINIIKKQFSKKYMNIILSKGLAKTKKSNILRKIFSIINEYNNNKKQKVVYILGKRFIIKPEISQAQKDEYIDYVLNNQQDKTNFVKITTTPFKRKADTPKLITFYLPQFHSFEENDNWFGKGFSEWSNAAKAVPQYTGHYQPHLPIDVGFYNLETTDILKRQIELAKMYGIYGFSFYYYWFSGKKIMEKPIEAFLKDKSLDMPFFMFWANEHWTRLWGDGQQDEILYRQELKDDDAEKFMADILPYMKDERYIKIDNKPVLIIYNPELYDLKVFDKFIKDIRRIARDNDFSDLYICTIRKPSMDKFNLKSPLDKYGLDAIVEFMPSGLTPDFMPKTPLIMNEKFNGRCFDVEDYVMSEKYNFETNCQIYKGLFPHWDNTARKCYIDAYIFESTPQLYKSWLKGCIDWTKQHNKDTEQFVFINAWNEWAEGAHLEPDQKYGYAYLQATKEALEETASETTKEPVNELQVN